MHVFMEMYVPSFSVSAKAIGLVAEISALVERYAIRLEQSDGLLLRKANRIKTIHSSLAIEGNELSEDEVRTVLEGKTVVVPQRQLQEVRNAIRAYEKSEKWDAYSVEDMLRAHGYMMEGLCPQAGTFRKGGVFLQVFLLAVHGNKIPRMGKRLHNFQFFLTRVTGYVHVIHSFVYHVATAFH